MKRYMPVIIGAVVAVLVLAFVKDLVIKVSVEKGVELVTGLKLRIGGLNVGVLKPVVGIRNLRLLNPPETT